MIALRARFPKWIITAALGAGLGAARYVSWKELADSVDYINLMTYAYSGVFSHRSAHNASLYAPTDSPSEGEEYIDRTVKALIETYKVVPSKILLGIPLGGNQFSTDKMGQPIPAGALHPGEPILVGDIAPLVASGDYARRRDAGGHAPYLERTAGGHTVSYDDEQSVAEKCAYAKDKGMSGI